ncbi:MAG: ribonuclease E activity regulator RraA [Xanthomonadaceae bacterium]|nr:ribonuclease E activity regulator RraA [Xanthomonadaceae bacterium]
MSNKTTDICDQFSERLRIAAPIFSDYGGRKQFAGKVTTVKVFEDNSLVRAALEEPGEGRVLVVDGGGSMRCALLGDQLAAMAQCNGWAGVVVYGCIRDSADIARIDLGVKALQTHPLRSVKKGVGERDVPVTFAGITIRPGDYLYADEDGVVVADEQLV